MSASRLMRGRAYHERLAPRRHAFDMGSAWAYLDLAEAGGLLDGSRLWSARGRALLRFRRADYFDGQGAVERGRADDPSDLSEAVLDQVEARLGRRPARPRVRILTHVRALGYVFNPVSFYFVFDEDPGDGGAGEPDSERLVAILAEITNTPWGQRFDYLFDAQGAAPGEELRFDFAKRFHVSPFFPLEHLYRWRFRLPGPDDERLEIHMTNVEEGREVFHAGMTLEGTPLTRRSLRRAALDYPWKTLRVHAAIYIHAGLLWLKRVPFFSNPHNQPVRAAAIQPSGPQRREPAPEPEPLTTP